MSFRAGLRTTNVLKNLTARPVSAAYTRHCIHSSSLARGLSKIYEVNPTDRTVYSNGNLSTPFHRAYISQPYCYFVLGNDGSASYLWIIFDTMSSQVHPTILCPQRRINSVYRTFGRHSCPYFLARSRTVPI